MNHKYIFFLILFHFSTTLIGMELILKEKKQWWYLDHRFEYEEELKSVCFNLNGTRLITTSHNNNAMVRDIQLNTITAEFPSSCKGKFHCFDPSQNLLATYLPNNRKISEILTASECLEGLDRSCLIGTNRTSNGNILEPFYWHNKLAHCSVEGNMGTASILDSQTGKIITSFSSPGLFIQDISFNHIGKSLATACDKTVHIFTQYDDYTLEQLQLKNAMNTWLLIKKPVLTIKKENGENGKILLKNILSTLLTEIADKKIIVPHFEQCNIENELMRIWKTLPENMQDAILRTMLHKIERYGRIDILEKSNDHGCAIIKS